MQCMEGTGGIPELVGLGVKTGKFAGIGIGWSVHGREYSRECAGSSGRAVFQALM
jgi:hypothetical protein